MRIPLSLLCLSLGFFSCNPKIQKSLSQEDASSNFQSMIPKKIDWQGHRGARGLLPENTIPSFLKALEYPAVTTLELDLAVSKDGQLIISHEPWMSEHICSRPDGTPVGKEEAKQLLIYQMSYEEIKQYDCGMRGNERFPEQKPLSVYKPSLRDMVTAVESYCKANGHPLPHYNIEIKSHPDGYGTAMPEPEKFVALCLAELKELGIKDRSNLQSFDFNVVREIHRQDPQMIVALLIENLKSPSANLEELGFTPNIYSPYFKLLNAGAIKELHEKQIKVIPWTVNEPEDMKKMIALGVDGIITDYPDRIEKALESFKSSN